MTASRASFEVQIQKESRWLSETNFDRENEAKSCAERLFSDRTCEGVRILRNWLRADGMIVETEIFCQTRLIKEDESIRIGSVTAPPPFCKTEADYLGFASHQFINRMFRAYLDKVVLTPFEIFHDFKEFKRLRDTDTLVSSAVDKVAQIQAKEAEVEAKVRRDQIFEHVSGLMARARKIEKVKLPPVGERLGLALPKLKAKEDDDAYIAAVALTRDLIGNRSWLGKLDRLTALAKDEDDAQAIDMIDHVLADVLMSNVLIDLLGSQSSLAAAIIAMFDLADGKMPVAVSDAGTSVAALNEILSTGKFPQCRLCLIDRAHRQLKSTQPLQRADATKEAGAFSRIIDRVLLPHGFISGPDTAEALTARYTRMVTQGGVAGRRAAIWGTLRAMPDMASGILYLTELLQSDYAIEHADDIVLKLNEALAKTTLVEFCESTLSARERMARAAHAYKILVPAPFPDSIKDRVLGHIDTLIDNYLVTEQIIEKLDHTGTHLRERAVRLVRFCASGVLPPKGKALTRTRTRILTLLRQPNFDQHFVDGIIDPVIAQNSLRDFHQLLVKAGFG